MREIDLSQKTEVMNKFTFLIYGATRTSKTTWSAGFPRPLFLSDVSEAGWESIKNMSEEQFFEPDVKPLVWGIETMTDVSAALIKADPMIASGEIQTIVVDSLSFYVDMVLNTLLMAQTKKDPRAAYGDLGNHLRDVRVKVHSRPVNVVWLCLEKTPDTDAPIGGPMIPGQQADKFAAGCHFIFRSTVHQEKKGQESFITYEMRTQKHGPWIAGNRLGNNAQSLPDPLTGTYSDMMGDLGYDVEAIRKNLPKRPTKSVAAPIKK